MSKTPIRCPWRFKRHDWAVVWAMDGRVNGWPITQVGSRCLSCKAVRVEQLDGFWDLEELTG